MDVLTKDELLVNAAAYEHKIQNSAVFIHPTDTIYGLGCDARSQEAVATLRRIKANAHNPFPIIAPSKHWILEHCQVSDAEMRWLDKLPGPYTLILRLKKRGIVSGVNLGYDTIGVRIPAHWISSYVAKLGFPIVSTAANLTGEDYMETIDDLPTRIKQSVDFAVYEGPLTGRPSIIVRAHEEEQLIER